MSNRDERFAEIESAWFDARDNYEDDRGKAPTQVGKKAVDKNHNQCFEAYSAALDSGLSKTGAAVETVYRDLKDANKAVKKAREDLEAFPQLIAKLTGATAGARALVAAAT